MFPLVIQRSGQVQRKVESKFSFHSLLLSDSASRGVMFPSVLQRSGQVQREMESKFSFHSLLLPDSAVRGVVFPSVLQCRGQVQRKVESKFSFHSLLHLYYQTLPRGVCVSFRLTMHVTITRQCRRGVVFPSVLQHNGLHVVQREVEVNNHWGKS